MTTYDYGPSDCHCFVKCAVTPEEREAAILITRDQGESLAVKTMAFMALQAPCLKKED